MNITANSIKQRLSLREPLQDSLDIIAQLGDVLTLKKSPAEQDEATGKDEPPAWTVQPEDSAPDEHAN